MQIFTVLSTVSLLLVVQSSEQRVLKNANNARVAGGTEVDIKDFPYQVYLRIKNSDGTISVCGGSIISNDWVVTAAHCVKNAQPADVTIYAGSADKYEYVDVHDISTLIRHPGYSTATTDCDIAVLKVTVPFNFDHENIQPISLIEENVVVPDGTKVIVSGWGHTNSTDEKPSHLRAAEVKIIDSNVCDEQFSHFTTNMICVDSDDGLSNSCSGDSGGPLVTEDRIQVGIVSFGHGCVLPLTPKVYSNVAALRSWVREQTSV